MLQCCGDKKRWEGDIILLAESSGEIIECERLVPALSDREMVNGAPEMMVAGGSEHNGQWGTRGNGGGQFLVQSG